MKTDNDVDDSNDKRITNDTLNNCYPSWSPDGSQIIFSAKTGETRKDRKIYLMNDDGTSEIIFNGSQAAWFK